jgi:hypothetical protein
MRRRGWWLIAYPHRIVVPVDASLDCAVTKSVTVGSSVAIAVG